MAHQGGDQREKPVAQRELEAEGVSYAVVALGLENPGSRDDLLQHEVTADELRASLSAIRALARRVLAIVAEPAAEEAARAA